MYRFDNALFTFPVTRKHFFSDKVYQLYLFNDEFIMTDNQAKKAKYEIKLNMTTTLNWIVSDKKIQAFEISYNNKMKAFNASPNKLQLLREMIAGRVFYSGIQTFYEIQMRVGYGMIGEVYRAVSQNGDYVAIKKCDKQKLASLQGGIPQLIQELQLLQQLSHINILKLKEVYSDQQFYYIVTEFVDGRTLHTELLSRPAGLSIIQTLKVMFQILSALIYIHSKGIMHRDINPHNIMISENIKLIDFGLARKIKNQLLFPTAGTPGYIAPEIINYKQEKPYDEKADIYSLGCMLYKMLSGENVFHRQKNIFQENKEGIFELRKNPQHPECSSNKMDQLFVLLAYMLENDPNERPNAQFCKFLLKEIENNNQQIDKLIRKQQIMRPIFVATDETPLERTPLSFTSNIKGKSSDTLMKSDDITTQGHKKLSKIAIKNV
ncbi:unnamed protein product (macronuclear) [Paramecium tetraurelia]|uniref:Protein kinase domain-containing protein n=1 Tax=Paramecium tetraurelia TaxID=5888 RepID=A0D6A6_PARTE|nr:uncharacterized protein GSPATT00039305001 [Paramecium tetraurelia]CAK78573.1 unnamed protein product [Paramecium tetraurelia]|eukprot:XP_001445970.1 hypothetical protein (macronuclear) [Paramecium tetraurelia strain d4-2]